MYKSKSGFTIVELLIVIVVIGILAAITIVAYNGVQQRARDTERKSDIATVEKLLAMYCTDHGHYPTRAEIRNPTWRAANFSSTDQSPFINPQDASSTNSFTAAGSSVAVDRYSYYESPEDVGTQYRLGYRLETDPTTYIQSIKDC